MKAETRFVMWVWLSRLSRFLLGGVFIAASVDKILNPGAFADILYSYNLIPDVAIHPMALWLPWIEMIAGILLIAGVWIRANTVILGGMLMVFIIALSINAFRGYNIDCGCFSTAGHGGGSDLVVLIVRDILLLIPVCLIGWKEIKSDQSPTR